MNETSYYILSLRAFMLNKALGSTILALGLIEKLVLQCHIRLRLQADTGSEDVDQS